MRASQKPRLHCINIRFQCQLGHVTPSHGFLVAMCIFMLSMLVVATEHLQLATEGHMNPINQWYIHPHHVSFERASLKLPSLQNVLPAMVLQNGVVRSNIWCLSCSSSQASIHLVSFSPGLSIPLDLGRMVVGLVMVLLLLMSGDVETNPGPVFGEHMYYEW